MPPLLLSPWGTSRPGKQLAAGETLPLPDPVWGFGFAASVPTEVAGLLDRLAGAVTTLRERDFDVVADDAWATGEVRVRIQP